MRKLPIPPLSTTPDMTKTSKQKTDEEKQAKKKELDQAALQGGALEAGLEPTGERGGGTWKLYQIKVSSQSDFSFNQFSFRTICHCWY